MILDTLENLKNYTSLNAHFADVVEFIKQYPLDKLPIGHHQIIGEDVYVNIVDTPIKSRQEAKVETHQRMIDIQVPITADEEHGFSPLSSLPSATYDAANDISFYPDAAETYFLLKPGQMVIYFPTDGHAPAITPTGLRKAIFKVRA